MNRRAVDLVICQALSTLAQGAFTQGRGGDYAAICRHIAGRRWRPHGYPDCSSTSRGRTLYTDRERGGARRYESDQLVPERKLGFQRLAHSPAPGDRGTISLNCVRISAIGVNQ
jgi:hypothetical protein